MDPDRPDRIEDELRRTLTSDALDLAPDPALAGRVRAGVRRTRRRQAGGAALVLAAAATSVVVVLTGGQPERAVDAPPVATPTATEPASPTPSEAPTGSPTTEATTSDDLAALVARPSTTLAGVHVERDGSAYTVSTLWEVSTSDPSAPLLVMGRSDDGFATATYRRVRSNASRVLADEPAGADDYNTCAEVAGGTTLCTRDATAFWTDDGAGSWDQAALPDLDDLLIDPVPSLAPDTFAVVGGGDGATLRPVDTIARSTDGGASFTTIDIVRFDDTPAFSRGEVVLGDGSLLLLLGGGVGDPQGVWRSAGEDWRTFARTEPTYSPPLGVEAEQGLDGLTASTSRDPVIWTVDATTGRLYVSTDNAATFTAIATR